MILPATRAAILSPANVGQTVPAGYWLSLGDVRLPINDWWGRAGDFPSIAAQERLPQVTLNFGDWMDA